MSRKKYTQEDIQQLGIKIAKNQDEAFWSNMKEKTLQSIEMAKKDMLINEYLLPFIEQNLEKAKSQ